MTTNDKVLVSRKTSGRELYSRYTSNHPQIHCNRFPGWMELSAAERKHWNKLAAAPQPGEDRKVGCEGEDGLLRVHSEATTCDVCKPAEASCHHCNNGWVTYDSWSETHHRKCTECNGIGKHVLPRVVDELPELPEGLLLTASGRLSYTADQMLAFRAEGIAYAQQRSVAIVVDEAMVERACAAAYGWWKFHKNIGEKPRLLDPLREHMRATITAALYREEG